jgi:hypothetical protein
MAYHQERLVTYNNRLHPWSVVRLLPASETKEVQQVIIRFRHRHDAEAHLQILRSKNPTASYELLFDITPKLTNDCQPTATPAYAARY